MDLENKTQLEEEDKQEENKDQTDGMSYFTIL